MALVISHAFVSAVADGVASDIVQPSNWNEGHVLEMTGPAFLGRLTAAVGVPEEIHYIDAWTQMGWVATTAIIFQMTTPPTGWTKQTTHDNKALRLVSGGTGGTAAGTSPFTTIFASVTSGSTALTISHMPGHTHSFTGTITAAGAHSHTYEGVNSNGKQPSGGIGSGSGWGDDQGNNNPTGSSGGHSHTYSITSADAGSGTGHTHTFNLAVQYVDVIYAARAAS